METNIDFLVVLISVGLTQALLLSLALLSLKRGNPTANRVFGIFLLVVSLEMAYGVLFHSRYILVLPHLFQVTAAIPFLYGPLLLFYFRALTRPGFRVGKLDLLHLLPYAICQVYFVPQLAQAADIKMDALIGLFLGASTESYVIGSLVAVHYLAYLIILSGVLQANRHTLARVGGASTAAGLRRQRLMLGLTSGFAVLWVFEVYDLIFAFEVISVSDVVQFAAISLFLLAAGYVVVRHPNVLSGEELALPKYASSTLDPGNAEAHVRRLKSVMAEDKPYRDGSLTLPVLARSIGVSPHLLSQLLNGHLGKNFSRFVNGYRVEDAMQQLEDPALEHFTIAAIAQEVGFNSLSSFNTAFKAVTGITPSQYQQRSRSAPSNS